jgi:hypothetical protein
MTEISPIEVSTEEYQESFTNISDAFDYFFEQIKLYHPVTGHLIQVGNEENYKVLINQKPNLNEGAAKISIIAVFQIKNTAAPIFKITIDDKE